MKHLRQTRTLLPLNWILILAVAYVLPGLVGHDPWKQDEPYILGIIQHMLVYHDWVVPNNAGIPFMEKPPLYYWTGAFFATLTRSWLPLHDGIRLASGFFTALTLLFTGLTARAVWGDGYGRLAVLALIASFGLLFESHIMITDVPMLTGYAIAYYGLLCAIDRPVWGGFWLGSGTGIGFLAKGMLIPGVLAVTVLLLLLFPLWRKRPFAVALGIALLAALPWFIIWPASLWLRSAPLFYEWFWLNNVGRFLGFAVPQLGASNNPVFWLRTLPWFAWPVLPLALLTLWRERQRITQHIGLQAGLVGFLVYLAVMQSSASARTAYGLPMLISLTLLATPSTIALPNAINRLGDYFARLIFLPAIILSWLVWGMMQITHQPPHWEWLTRGLSPGFVMPFHPVAVLIAFSATLVWFANWWVFPHLRERAVWTTALSVTVFWLLFSTLWLPWVDNAKRYREVFASVIDHLPKGYHCVSGMELNESTRPMFDYYLGMAKIAFTHELDPQCNALLIDQHGLLQPPSMPNWKLVWQGNRPQEDKDRFLLYVKTTPSTGF
uniref:Putative transmembrane protein n=1 Tax=mine drainage metagenome TaxID=410659 RepID=E6QQT2_9ZZZZ